MLRLQIPQIRTAIAVVVAAILIAGCASDNFSGSAATPETRAERLRDAGRYADAAGIYIGLASSAVGLERDRLTLLATEQWLNAGDGRRAQTAMSDVAIPNDANLRALWNLNRAAIELWEGEPDRALSILEPMSAEPQPPARRARIQALRGDAWFQKDDPLRAIALYSELERWLNDSRAVEQNRQRLWAGLLVSDPQVLQSKAQLSNDPLARGWLSLGALAAATGQQGIGWTAGVTRWRTANPSHPGFSVLGEVAPPETGALDYPRNVALLLPLSGRNAAAGRAVQNGFMGGYFAASAGLEEAQQIRVYDVAEAGSAASAYAQALDHGAEFVVGPLVREQVTQLAAESVLSVPVLALNYVAANRPAPAGMYQFALAPEDEAAAAARRAIQDGRTRALAFVPNNDWGRRLLSSFTNELRAQGGELLQTQYYAPTDQDFSPEIRSLMGLTWSQQRHDRLSANLQTTIEFDPRRRADAQFIFLAATAPVGRLIKSQLKFHFSGDVPVYATSRIYAMDGRSNRDLNGIGFADTPWIIAPHAGLANLPKLYVEYWPGERRLGRLHAMGYDAYLLLNELHAQRESALSVNGATGRLFMGLDDRIHRDLPWAEFQSGQPVFMPLAIDERGDGSGEDRRDPANVQTDAATSLRPNRL